jgi:hypothetical protein
VAISRASNSSIQGGLPKFNDIWDGTTATSSFDTLGAVVLSAAAGSVTFASIPDTYTHLQLRIMAQTNRGTYAIDEPQIRLNTDAGNYSAHMLWGDGSTVTATDYLGTNVLQLGSGCIGTTTGSNWGIVITDIFDYTNTSKYKVIRTLSGTDCNGTVGTLGGRVGISSGSWRSLVAVNNIYIIPGNSSSFSANSSFALYGIK